MPSYVHIAGDPYTHRYRRGNGDVVEVVVQDAGLVCSGNPFPAFFRLRLRGRGDAYPRGWYRVESPLEVWGDQLRVPRYPRLQPVPHEEVGVDVPDIVSYSAAG